MKIALIGCYPQSYKDPFSTYLCLSSLENYFESEGHSVRVLQPSLLQSASFIAEFDRLVLVGNPFDERRSPWAQWLVSVHPELCERITLLGMKGVRAEALLDEQKKVLEIISKQNPIGVCDRSSKEQLSTFLSSKNIILSGLPVFWADGRPLRLKKKTRLFLPAAVDPVFAKRTAAWAQLNNRFYRRWNQIQPAVYGSLHSDCMDLAGTANEWTFFQPSSPALFLNALVSADAVVSGHAAELLVAVQNSVPGILLTNDPNEKSMADAAGIPFLETHTNSQAAELAHRTEELLSRYPWDAVKQKRAALEQRTAEYLSQVGLAKKAHGLKKRSSPPVADRHWATLASETNVAAVLGWVENLLSIYEGRNHFHILCGSRTVEAALETSLRPGSWTAYSLGSLWSEGEWQSCMRYDTGYVLKASKPRFLLKALATSKSEIIYSDAEVLFFKDPSELVCEAEVPAALIARYSDTSTETSSQGLYSAALFSVQPSAEAFLNWWASFTLEPRSVGALSKNFSEGKILDSAPLLFPTIKIVREPGVLAEAGNRESTCIERPEWPGHYLESFRERAVAAHLAVGVDALHTHEIKAAWNQLAAVFIQTRKAFESGELRDAVWLQQRLHWPRLDAFFCVKEWWENHIPMLQHRPGVREVRFFTVGSGRLWIRLATWLGLSAPPYGNARLLQTSSSTGLWKTWQKTILTGLFYPPASVPASAAGESPRHTRTA